MISSRTAVEWKSKLSCNTRQEETSESSGLEWPACRMTLFVQHDRELLTDCKNPYKLLYGARVSRRDDSSGAALIGDASSTTSRLTARLHGEFFYNGFYNGGQNICCHRKDLPSHPIWSDCEANIATGFSIGLVLVFFFKMMKYMRRLLGLREILKSEQVPKCHICHTRALYCIQILYKKYHQTFTRNIFETAR